MNEIKRRQINDITVPERNVIKRPSIMPLQTLVQERIGEPDRIVKNPFFEKTTKIGNKRADDKKGGSRKIVFALLFAALLGSAFLVVSYFTSATIDVVPIQKESSLDESFTANKSSADQNLSFKFMSLVEEKSKDVPAILEKMIQTKASGRVVLFNSYSSAPQKLIKNTRLETADHKIFRINDSVVIPGTRLIGGKMTPGSVEVVVYADASGTEYNIGTANFTIPGFIGDPRYTKFTAVSKPSSPLSGGFSGTIKVPSDEAVALASEELKNQLKKEAVEKARGQIPPNVTFFPGSMIIKFEDVPRDSMEQDMMNKVTVRATVSVFFFDTKKLTEKIVASILPEEKERSFAIVDISKLTFSFIDPVDKVVLEDLEKIHFRLAGALQLVGKVDRDKILSELAGKDKKDFSTIISKIPNVAEGTKATISPVWENMFPRDPAQITVNIKSR